MKRTIGRLRRTSVSLSIDLLLSRVCAAIDARVGWKTDSAESLRKLLPHMSPAPSSTYWRKMLLQKHGCFSWFCRSTTVKKRWADLISPKSIIIMAVFVKFTPMPTLEQRSLRKCREMPCRTAQSMSSVVFLVIAATKESKALVGSDLRGSDECREPRLENVGKFPKAHVDRF